MLKNYTLVCFLLFFSFLAKSKNDFQIVSDDQNNLFVLGCFSGELSFSSGIIIGDYYNTEMRYFLAKYNSTGNCLWAKDIVGSTKIVSSSVEGGAVNSCGLALDPSGNVYISSSSSETYGYVLLSPTDTLFLTDPSSSAFVAKYTTNGDVVWSKEIVGSSEGSALTADENGFIYATGRFDEDLTIDNLPAIANTSFQDGIYVCKLDLNGNAIWVNAIHNTQQPLYVTGVEVQNSGAVYVSGKISSSSGQTVVDGITLATTKGGYITKFASNGAAEWLRAYPISGLRSNLQELTSNSQDEILFTGQFGNTIDFGNGNVMSTSGSSDVYYAKINDSGDWLWAKKSNADFGYSYAIDVDPNDNIWLSANTEVFEYAPLPLIDLTPTEATISSHIVKLDSAGDGVCFFTSDTINFNPDDICFNSSGELYFISAAYYHGSNSYHIGKVDTNCNLLWVEEAQMDESLVGITEQGEEEIQVFPNPVNKEVTVIVSNKFTSGTLVVRNFYGEIVHTDNFEETTELTFNLNQPAGIYFIDCLTENGDRHWVEKIVKF